MAVSVKVALAVRAIATFTTILVSRRILVWVWPRLSIATISTSTTRTIQPHPVVSVQHQTRAIATIPPSGPRLRVREFSSSVIFHQSLPPGQGLVENQLRFLPPFFRETFDGREKRTGADGESL